MLDLARPTMLRTFLVLLATLTSVGYAHAVMSVPQPYGFDAGLTNGPMQAGAFPCNRAKTQVLDRPADTDWLGGSALPLHLLTSATHGGGTCLIALTYAETDADQFYDPSAWRVIHVLPGECPATTAGNLDTVDQTQGYPSAVQCAAPDSDQPDCVHSYGIPMPDQLKPGRATLGWIWFSRVTPETYMNCAPVNVSGAVSSGDFDALPNLQQLRFDGLDGNRDFLAGLAASSLLTQTVSSSGISSPSSSSPSSSSASSSSPSTTLTTSSSFISTITPSSSPTLPSIMSCPTPAVECSGSGFFCLNETSFAQCVSGCAMPMSVADGTVCTDIGLADGPLIQR